MLDIIYEMLHYRYAYIYNILRFYVLVDRGYLLNSIYNIHIYIYMYYVRQHILHSRQYTLDVLYSMQCIMCYTLDTTYYILDMLHYIRCIRSWI